MKDKEYIGEQLEKIGFVKETEKRFVFNDRLCIIIDDDTTLAEVFKDLINMGAQLDRWKLQEDLDLPYYLK